MDYVGNNAKRRMMWIGFKVREESGDIGCGLSPAGFVLI